MDINIMKTKNKIFQYEFLAISVTGLGCIFS